MQELEEQEIPVTYKSGDLEPCHLRELFNRASTWGENISIVINEKQEKDIPAELFKDFMRAVEDTGLVNIEGLINGGVKTLKCDMIAPAHALHFSQHAKKQLQRAYNAITRHPGRHLQRSESNLPYSKKFRLEENWVPSVK